MPAYALYALYGVGIMAVTGAVLGGVLLAASRFFYVEVDERIERILEALPNANCGACGYGGCAAYAEAVVKEGASCNLCIPGGAECSAVIASVMGVEAEETTPMVAVIHCGGSDAVAPKSADLYGVRTCAAASVDGVNSPKACLYGCLGFGDCVRACPFDALAFGPDGMPQVIESKCVACGKCVAACPRNIISLRPKSSHVHVYCVNRDKGKDVRKVCEVGCIGCGRCEKECPFDAIHVEDNLAVIDYEKCKSCGKCVKVCPTSAIVNLRKVRKEAEKMLQAADGGEGAR